MLLSNIVSSQNISGEVLSAINKGNSSVLDQNISEETLNTCFDLKESSYNYLAISIKMNKMESLKYFVEKGADLEHVCTGKTPLMYAVKYGQMEMVKYLIEKGAKISTETSKGKTALDYARKYKQKEIEEFLEDQSDK